MNDRSTPRAEVDTRPTAGSLLGAAIGDALGLPYEGVSPRRAARLLGPPDRFRLLPGRGMVSDDTEHACMVAQALIEAGDDVDKFALALARRLRGWLLALPAGIGKATLLACFKLCLGASPDRSGVFSAGNGPAMRSPLLGAAIDDVDLLRRLVRASTRITHTDPKAEWGALAVALAARAARRETPIDGAAYVDEVRALLAGESADDLLDRLEQAAASVTRGEETTTYAAALGLQKGVTGYVNHTVPVAIHAWLRHPRDYREAVGEIIRCGGDADSTAAIVGGIVGCAVGVEGIPAPWRERLVEWPRSVAWMERLAEQLADVRTSGTTARPPELPLWGTIPRNLFFFTVVIAHIFRRFAPPY